MARVDAQWRELMRANVERMEHVWRCCTCVDVATECPYNDRRRRSHDGVIAP